MTERKHSHYFKDVSHLKTIDVYRVLALFNVTDPCLQHAIKKLLVAGGRGAGKGMGKDIQEAIDTLQRQQQMHSEDGVSVHDWWTFKAFQDMKRNVALPVGDVNGDAARTWLAQMQEASAVKEDKVSKLKNLCDIQCSDPSSKTDNYMRGMANGLQVATSVFTGKDPCFISAPATAPATSTTDPVFVAAYEAVCKQDVPFALEARDLRIDVFRADKDGSWSNGPDTCARITHTPTGLAVESKDERSVHANKVRAMQELTVLVAKRLGHWE